MKTEKGVACNGCRQELSAGHPVSSFTERPDEKVLPNFHLCGKCKAEYEAKSGLKLKDLSSDGKEIKAAG